MIAEYAHYYGGPPAGSMPWPLFQALAARTGRFEARKRLTFMDAVREAIGAAFGGSDAAGLTERARGQLFREAYPVAGPAEPLLRENLAWVPDVAEEPTDG